LDFKRLSRRDVKRTMSSLKRAFISSSNVQGNGRDKSLGDERNSIGYEKKALSEALGER